VRGRGMFILLLVGPLIRGRLLLVRRVCLPLQLLLVPLL